MAVSWVGLGLGFFTVVDVLVEGLFPSLSVRRSSMRFGGGAQRKVAMYLEIVRSNQDSEAVLRPAK